MNGCVAEQQHSEGRPVLDTTEYARVLNHPQRSCSEQLVRKEGDYNAKKLDKGSLK